MNPNVQFPISIDSERLNLRRYTVESASGLLDLIDQNRSELKRNFGTMVQQLTCIENTVEFINAGIQQWQQGTMYQYGIFRSIDDRLIGQIKIKNIDYEKSALELSYFIGRNWQRLGYAKESIQAVIHSVFEELGFQKIIIRIIASNFESLQLADKLGFMHDGIRQQDFVCGYGEVHDVHYLIYKNSASHG